MRLAILGPSWHPVGEPFAGGQERFTADLTRGLRERGHHVELYALPDSDATLADRLHPMPSLPPLSAIASADPQMPEPTFLQDQYVYVDAIRELLYRNDIDAILNESLHQLPLALSPLVPVPMITTLHTPPIPWMEVGAWMAGTSGCYVAVSEAVRDQWNRLTVDRVVPNGVDPRRFPVGPGGDELAWVGRLTPEKGTDLAIEAARRAGRGLRIAGPVSDSEWFETVVRPLLGGDITYVGALGGADLAELYGTSAATLVTPRWEEPFCLVAAESQMCGTPVIALRRGGLPEVVTAPGSMLVTAAPHSTTDPVTGLAGAIDAWAPADRALVGAHARRHLSLAAMITGYESVLEEVCAGLERPTVVPARQIRPHHALRAVPYVHATGTTAQEGSP